MTLLRKERVFYPLWWEATMPLCIWGQETALSCWTFTKNKNFHAWPTEVKELVGCPSSSTFFWKEKHNSICLPSMTHPACWWLCLPLFWLLAIPPFLWSCGASPQSFTNPQDLRAMLAECKLLLHLCLFSQSACSSWELLWRNQSLDCAWQL